MRDAAILPGSLQGLDADVQDLTVIRIDDAGHTPMRSHPGPVNRAIRAFRGRRPG